MQKGKIGIQQLSLYLTLTGLIAFFILATNYYFTDRLLAGYNIYDAKRIIEILLLLLIAITIIFSKKQTEAWLATFSYFPTYTQWFLLAILVIGCVSAGLSPNPTYALIELGQYVLLFVFTLFLVSNILSGNITNQFIIRYLFWLPVLNYLIVFAVVFFYHHGTLRSLVPGFANPRFFSHYQVWTLFLLSLPLYQKPRGRMAQIGLSVLLILWWLLVFISQSKGLWISLVVAIFFLFAFYRKQCLKWVIFQSGFAVLAGLLYSLFWVIIPLLAHTGDIVVSGTTATMGSSGPVSATVQAVSSATHSPMSQTLYQSTIPRLYLWLQGIKLFIQHPWLGVGPMHYAFYPNDYAAHPHNSFLLILSEWGVAVAALLVAIFIGAGYRWYRCFHYRVIESLPVQKKYLIFALSSTLMAGFSYSLGSGVMVTPLSQIMSCLVIAWAVAVFYQQRGGEALNQSSSVFRQTAFVGMVIVCCTLLVGLLWPIVRTLPQDEIKWLARSNFQATLMPRFWLQGKISNP